MESTIPGTGTVTTTIESTTEQQQPETPEQIMPLETSETTITETVENAVTSETIGALIADEVRRQAEAIGDVAETAVLCQKVYSVVLTLTELLASLTIKVENIQTLTESLSMRFSELTTTIAEAVRTVQEEEKQENNSSSEQTTPEAETPVISTGANRKPSLLDRIL